MKMTGGRHQAKRQQASARAELKSIGGSLAFWDWFNVKRKEYPPLSFAVKKEACRQIAVAAQHLLGKLSAAGIKDREEPLVGYLENLEGLFRNNNPNELLHGQGGRTMKSPSLELIYCYPGRLRFIRRKPTAEGRPAKRSVLYSLLPGLAIYTALNDGHPKWELARRLIVDETSFDGGNLYLWWHEKIAPLTEKQYLDLPRDQRKIIRDSVEAYLYWSLRHIVDSWPKEARREDPLRLFNEGRPLNKNEERYCQIALRLCPFLKKEIESWMEPLAVIKKRAPTYRLRKD